MHRPAAHRRRERRRGPPLPQLVRGPKVARSRALLAPDVERDEVVEKAGGDGDVRGRDADIPRRAVRAECEVAAAVEGGKEAHEAGEEDVQEEEVECPLEAVPTELAQLHARGQDEVDLLAGGGREDVRVRSVVHADRKWKICWYTLSQDVLWEMCAYLAESGIHCRSWKSWRAFMESSVPSS